MKKGTYYPIAVMIAIILLCALFLLFAANGWLLIDFRLMESREWHDIVKAIGIVAIDVCIIAFGICCKMEKNSSYDEDDDCE